MDEISRRVAKHYGRHEDIVARTKNAYARAGGDPAHPNYEGLRELDQFHMGGAAATREMGEVAGLRRDRILDVGCGMGGPARTLAAEFGCEVTGVDLTEIYCRAAAELSQWVDLADRTRFVCASAMDLPFPDDCWPVVWSQHAAMNIADKEGLYREMARVLAPGGRLVLHDIVAGPVREPRYPVPWAGTPSDSYLLPGQAVHKRIADAGLREEFWEDATSAALAAIRRSRADREAGAPEAPGPHLVMGQDFLDMRKNVAANLEEGRIGVIKAIWRKPV